MKKMLATAGAAAVMLGLLGAGAADAAPGPNDSNNKGLCTAYFNGSERGQEQKRKAGPFVALQEAADDEDDSTTPEQDVAAFCEGMIGGNPLVRSGEPGGGKSKRP